MNEKKVSNLMVSQQTGVFRNLINRTKLIWRLLADNRVSPWLKLIPVGALIYWISPVDLIMGIPGLDAIDDITVLYFGSTLFVELCPPNIVKEHMKALAGNMEVGDAQDEVVDAEATDVSDKQPK
jgi:uncharacterized membrane protein YkvA (DUF1232 family)